MIIITVKFATRSEKYVGWGNNINFIFMSPWGIKIHHPLWTMLVGANNTNFKIFMRD